MKVSAIRVGKSLATMAVLAAASNSVWAATKSYIGPNNGNFNTASYWSASGVPADGDDVILGNMNPTNITDNLAVTLSTTEPVGTATFYDSFTVNSSGLPAYMIVNQTSGALTAYDETIGSTANENSFNQSGGATDYILDALDIGVSSSVNLYTLSGTGTILSLQGAVMNVGLSGSGIFTQSGGIVTSGSSCNLGVNSSGNGTINISGSAEFSPYYLNVGGAGTGTFNQSGGDVSTAITNIGSTGSTSSGTYNFSGGTIEGSITLDANGVFNLQSGGVLDANVLINTGGVFKMAGGSFGANNVSMQGGIFELLGYNPSVTGLTGLSGTVENGASTTSTLTVNMQLQGSNTPAQFSGVVKDGSTGALSLSVTGGASYGIGLKGANTYSGTTSVSALLQAEAAGAFSANSAVGVLGGGTLDASTFAVSIGSLSGTTGTVNIGMGGNLSIGGLNTSTFFAGQITGAGTITKVGTRTLTLNGGGTFTGNIAISTGILATNVVNGIPTGASVGYSGTTGTLAVNANQTLASYTAGDSNITTFSNSANLTVNAGTNGCNFTGAGTLTMAGTGTYYLGSGSSDNTANSNSSITIAVSNGTLALNKAAGTNSVAGPLQISGGTALLSASNQIADTSTVTLSGGTFNLAGYQETIGGLTGAAGAVNLNGGQLTVSNSSDMTFSGSLIGNGGFTKTAGGNLILSNISAYTGAYTVSSGQLTLQGTVEGSAFTVNGTGILEFSGVTLNIPGIVLQSSSGSGIEYLNSTISNAYLRGPSAHTILSGGTSTFNGITTYNSTVVTQNGPAVFNNFSNGGTINNNAVLTFSGGTNAGTGIINVNNALSTQDFGSEGVINIAAGATLTNSISDIFLEGGSRTYIGSTANPGGTLTLQNSTTIEVNGALLVNDGTISGTTDVNYGGTAEGTGTYGPVNVTFGGVFQPGISSTIILANNSTQVSALSGDGTIDNVAAAGNITLNVNTSIANSFTGTIQNSNGQLALNLTGGGSLTLLTHPIVSGNSINTYTGGTAITSGSLIIGAAGAFSAGTPVLNNGSFFIYANSTIGQITGSGNLTVGSATANAVATLAPKSGISTLASLSIATGSRLDVTNNDVILHSGSLSQIATMIASAYQAGAWNGATGILSSLAAASAHGAITLGVGTNLTNFDGGTVVPTDVEIKYTWLGDANLDGVVNSADLSAMSPAGTTWQTGDFNYDNKVNADDYALFMLGNASSSGVNISNTLPEPAALLIVPPLLLAFTTRNRRR